jgi:hypothetical protein
VAPFVLVPVEYSTEGATHSKFNGLQYNSIPIGVGVDLLPFERLHEVLTTGIVIVNT